MYSVEFYETDSGKCGVWDFLEELRAKSAKNKDTRIQYKQITLCIELLQQKGTYLPDNITKFIDDGIWELRPGCNRIFYFYYDNNTFVLLHHFRKKTNKTPPAEIQKAKNERDDYLRRKEKL